jgi:hypothetical protein
MRCRAWGGPPCGAIRELESRHQASSCCRPTARKISHDLEEPACLRYKFKSTSWTAMQRVASWWSYSMIRFCLLLSLVCIVNFTDNLCWWLNLIEPSRISSCIFFKITQYNADTHNARTLTPMNARTQTLPLWASSKTGSANPGDWRSRCNVK